MKNLNKPALQISEPLPPLCCPLCKGGLGKRGDAYNCVSCEKVYPVILGIPDFRVYSDPFITIEEDHEKGSIVQDQARHLNFPELLHFYWENVSKPPTPVELRESFIRHVLADKWRVRTFQRQLGSGRTCLDLGCGAGFLLSAVQESFSQVIGCDIAFRWLILQRKRLEESGISAHLICCCADYLPFAPQSCDAVAAISVLEHVRNAESAIAECRRVLKTGGRLFVWTANRFSFAPEPHVRIWGLGFLPRRWMNRFVKWRRGLSYDKLHLLSYFDMRRLVRKVGLENISFSLPEIVEEDFRGRSWLEKLGARLFRFVQKLPPVRKLLLPIAPALLMRAENGETALSCERGG